MNKAVIKEPERNIMLVSGAKGAHDDSVAGCLLKRDVVCGRLRATKEVKQQGNWQTPALK